MIIFIYGPDTFRSRIYLKKMIDKFKADRDPAGYNITELDCLNSEEVQKVMSEILAIPFLAEKRMVIVKNLISSKEVELKKELRRRIEEKDLPETSIIVVSEESEKFRAKADKEFLELLKKEKYKEYFKVLEGKELSVWVNQEVKMRGGSIDRKALSYIVDNFNSDMWSLSHLVDQLTAYKSDGKVELEDVKKFLEEKIDDNIFNLVDAIVAGKKDQAFKMMREQYRKGEDSFYVFAMILRQFKIMLQIRDLIDRGIKPDAKELGLHPFVVKKTIPLVNRYSMAQLKEIYNQLLQIDIKTKTGQGDQSVMLDLFVGSIHI